MIKPKLALALSDWRVYPDSHGVLHFSVGIVLLDPPEHQHDPGRPVVHRISNTGPKKTTQSQKIQQVKKTAEHWIKSYLKAQELQDKLNREAQAEIEATFYGS